MAASGTGQMQTQEGDSIGGMLLRPEKGLSKQEAGSHLQMCKRGRGVRWEVGNSDVVDKTCWPRMSLDPSPGLEVRRRKG